MTSTAPAAADVAPESPFGGSGETRPDPSGRPVQPEPEPRSRWWRRRTIARGQRAASNEGKPDAKGKGKRRVSAVEDFTDLSIGAGNLICNRTPYFATGRAVALNGSTTGQMLDDAIAGSLLDRRGVQPLVRNRARFEAVLAIFETPGLLFAIERILLDPDLAYEAKVERIDRLVPSLNRAVRRALPYMATAIVKVRKREEELAKAAVAIYGEQLGSMVDPVAGVVDDLLAPIRQALEQMAQHPGTADPGAGLTAEGIPANG